MSEKKVIDITLKATIHDDRAMFFRVAGATVEEGPYKGTAIDSSVGSGAPIITVRKDGKVLGALTFNLQDLIKTAIDVIEKEGFGL